ncbi:MFS transporter [Phyllobacterium myrsinacearum]|uniref:MFS family permease n=1 Tax=Phyllobacterium myrsinacearum TaxID=28101 RepID=A0A839ER98_9HYPH|nr:MFS transporter [Phyllobacterium myrsinacearum]MBA8880655.1 MFS family permease [Phyllobacterium myrsinacearum]
MAPAQSSSSQHSDWLVGNPTRVQQWAALWIGSAGLQILGLQPILLGALYSEKRVNFDELAMIATAEFITIALGSVIAGMLLSTRHLRTKSAVLLAALAVLNYAVSYATTPNELLILRSVAGLLEGGTVAISIELIARSHHAERLGGFFILLQTLAQCLLAALLALWVVPAMGSSGGFHVLAAVFALSLIVAYFVPSEYGDLPKQPSNMDGVLTVRAILALLALFTFWLFIGALWAFLEPLGARYGIEARSVGLLVSTGLAFQVLGVLCATWIDRRLDYRLAIVACSLVAMSAAAILAANPSLQMFWIAVLAITFVWMFIAPYHIGLAVAADSSRSSALLVPAAQILGAAMGPIAASLFITNDDVGIVPVFGMGALLCSLALFGTFLLFSRRRAITV